MLQILVNSKIIKTVERDKGTWEINADPTKIWTRFPTTFVVLVVSVGLGICLKLQSGSTKTRNQKRNSKLVVPHFRKKIHLTCRPNVGRVIWQYVCSRYCNPLLLLWVFFSDVDLSRNLHHKGITTIFPKKLTLG